jgi:hypothetical protein
MRSGCDQPVKRDFKGSIPYCSLECSDLDEDDALADIDEEEQPPLKHIFFDFDCTLTAQHVFNCLSGRSGWGVAPFALTEAGQLARLKVFEDEGWLPQSSFLDWAFGGRGRIEMLHKMLRELRRARIDLTVVTHGYVGPCRKLLDQAGMLQYFVEVTGQIGDFYGVSSFDIGVNTEASRAGKAGDDVKYFGGPGSKLDGSKWSYIAGKMMHRGLRHGEVLFLDDTIEEVQSVASSCRTMHVGEGGIGRPEVTKLLGECKSDRHSENMLQEEEYGEKGETRSPHRKNVRNGEWNEVEQHIEGPCTCQ